MLGPRRPDVVIVDRQAERDFVVDLSLYPASIVLTRRRRLHRIRRNLGASSNLLVPFPNKPARMHWRTYYRIRAKGERYEARVFARLAAWLEGRKRR